MPLSSHRQFDQALAFAAESVERTMDRLLPSGNEGEARLFEAMRYSSLGGGKRLRAFFVLAGATLFKVAAQPALRTACAIEFVHAYSLIHDDLPAMDDDDLRRGKPSCHKQFDEATAILAGDALQALAFEVLAHDETHGDPAVRAALVTELARASGAHGMVGGQMLDLLAESQKGERSIGAITRLQRLKTGALISFSCTAGAILGKASDHPRAALLAYAHDLGLAFQIADDLLDVEGTVADLGKTPGKDAQAGKATFVSILGLERARAQAGLLARQAAAHLDSFGEAADLLRQAADFVVARRT
ncbi:MAG: polyprenyl synthetase family protein [Reyranella sp.]|uniref:polyprenyl synthetase family protein n=1 Tax=Reyranella sp. TaxID=1929291 RepID=UPI00272F448F|nr:farnesyl diphosphate synthase [Reyranella sp.]MDP1961293.1 polyprenyl synthetase family protein [Reyranella sp.]MDP2378352.1 polyprenyl synthetase family protein [Reyranella sp.]